MNKAVPESIVLDGGRVECQLIRSKTARKLRVRVGLDGVKVIAPKGRTSEDIATFLRQHREWIAGQLKRVETLRVVRKPQSRTAGEVPFRGIVTPVRVERIIGRRGTNQVIFANACLVVRRSKSSRTSAARSLENWFRKQARTEISTQLNTLTKKLRRVPRKVYVMGQRTKWGNCSALQNLSFSWRLIMMPEFVMRYLVTHEAVHLAVPDHSAKFWITVLSICPEMERAKQWLARNGARLPLNLDGLIPE